MIFRKGADKRGGGKQAEGGSIVNLQRMHRVVKSLA
jgi:hypothetical protein